MKRQHKARDAVPNELLGIHKMPSIPVLTTSHAISTVPASVPTVATSDIPPAAEYRGWQNNTAGVWGGPPTLPPQLEIGPDFNPAIGVYILAAGTGVGKTILSMALAAWANSMQIASTYISCFEPRSPVWKLNNTTMFKNPESFWDDADRMRGKSNQAKLLIFDSVTLPMKAYASVKGKNQATFAGGMQPSDRSFLDRGTQNASNWNSVIILDLNTTLIPYVNDLAGGVEGLIQPRSVGQFSFQDRTPASGRIMRSVTVPDPFVEAALDYFKFGTFNRKKTTSFKLGFSGL